VDGGCCHERARVRGQRLRLVGRSPHGGRPGDHWDCARGAERNQAFAKYNVSMLRVRMLASRVRDEELRSAVKQFLEVHETMVENPEGVRGEGEETRAGMPEPPDTSPPFLFDSHVESLQMIYDRAGELIRTLGALDGAR
jgi:hypothetical protein